MHRGDKWAIWPVAKQPLSHRHTRANKVNSMKHIAVITAVRSYPKAADIVDVLDFWNRLFEVVNLAVDTLSDLNSYKTDKRL